MDYRYLFSGQFVDRACRRLTSHAGASGRSLLLLTDGLHLAAALMWAGPLLYLAAVDPPQATVEKFSAVAVPSVVVLSIAGVAMGLSHIEHPAELVNSQYGRRLVLKVVLVALALFAAAVNRFRLLPAGDAVALRKGLVAESLLVLGVIFVTGALTTTDLPGE
jgi:putative copper export protein